MPDTSSFLHHVEWRYPIAAGTGDNSLCLHVCKLFSSHLQLHRIQTAISGCDGAGARGLNHMLNLVALEEVSWRLSRPVGTRLPQHLEIKVLLEGWLVEGRCRQQVPCTQASCLWLLCCCCWLERNDGRRWPGTQASRRWPGT